MSRRKLIEYINSWLNQFKKTEKDAVEMNKLKDYLEWEQKTIEQTPSTYISIDNVKSNEEYYAILLEQLEEKYPIYNNYDPTFLVSNNVIASSTGSSIFEISENLLTYTSLGEKESDKIELSLKEKESLDDTNDRINLIKECLTKIDFTIHDEFTESVNQYYLNHDQNKNYITGIAMRNVIEHLNGKFWTRAKRPNEQKCKLDLILTRLGKSEVSLNDYQIKQIVETY